MTLAMVVYQGALFSYSEALATRTAHRSRPLNCRRNHKSLSSASLFTVHSHPVHHIDMGLMALALHALHGQKQETEPSSKIRYEKCMLCVEY